MKKFLPAIFVSVLFLTLTACESKFAKPESCVGAACEAQTMKVDAPIISPNGGSHPAGTPIVISSSTGGSKIIYTVDGSEPKANEDGSLENGVLYQSTIPLNVTKIKAVAIKEGMEDSEVTESNYSVTAPNSPTFDPDGGTYNLTTFPVSLVAPAHGCDEMRYTKSVNNNNSGPSEQVYSNPIDVTATNTTIGSVCIKAGISSPESFATYTLKVPSPKIKHVSCPLTPIPQQLSDLGIINSLHAGLPSTPPTQISVACTECVEVTLINTVPAPYKVFLRSTYVDPSSLAPQWILYTGPTSCNTLEATVPNGINNFNVEAYVTKAGMAPSDVVTKAFAK